MAGWKITDYTAQNIRKKTTSAINKEYERMRKNVGRRVSTFEKHGLGKLKHVKAVKTAMDGNMSRRDKERAILEMKRFLYLETSSYTSYVRYRKEEVAKWQDRGVNVTASTYDAFTDFLEWSKSFYKGKYVVDDVKQNWNKVSGDLEAAIDFFAGRYLGKNLPSK